MKGVKERLVSEGIITTIIGMTMLVFCGLLMYQGKQTAEELSGWLTTAMLFLRSKDSILGFNKNMEKE